MHVYIRTCASAIVGRGEINFAQKIMILANWAHLRVYLWAYLMAQVPCKVAYGGPQHGQSIFGFNFGEKIGQEGQNSFKT